MPDPSINMPDPHELLRLEKQLERAKSEERENNPTLQEALERITYLEAYNFRLIEEKEKQKAENQDLQSQWDELVAICKNIKEALENPVHPGRAEMLAEIREIIKNSASVEAPLPAQSEARDRILRAFDNYVHTFGLESVRRATG